MKAGYHKWTDAETRLLFELREDEGWEWDRISRHLRVSAHKCEVKYNNERARRRLVRGDRFEKAPNAAFIERERRDLARRAQSLTGSVSGDPPPGYSALDRRRSA